MSLCKQCGIKTERSTYQYCSNQCQRDYEYFEYIKVWKDAGVSGNRGIKTLNISGHIRRYLQAKYGTVCSLCGWSRINQTTGRVPLEIDHIDGNAENNSEVNLRLLCPNCHSLAPNFRNLNKGKGRDWRRLKYLKTN